MSRRSLQVVALCAYVVASLAAPHGLAAQQRDTVYTRRAFTTASTQLRASPASDASEVAQIPEHALLRVGTCAKAWCQAALDDRVGYVTQTALTFTQSVDSTPTGKGYRNSRGEWVPSPTKTPDNQPPSGATAQCRDGTYSFSRTRSGTCSHHGGVARWLP